jgi:hypothetical protein
VVLVSGLTNISITSGQNIPGTRDDNSQSLYVIMDVKPLRDTRLNVASRLCAQDPSKSTALIEQLKQMTVSQAQPGATNDNSTGNIMDLLKELHDMVEGGGPAAADVEREAEAGTADHEASCMKRAGTAVADDHEAGCMEREGTDDHEAGGIERGCEAAERGHRAEGPHSFHSLFRCPERAGTIVME